MFELYPIVGGLILGIVLGLLAPRVRLVVGAALSVALGAIATIVSGEYLISWEYLIVDIPLVVIGAVIAMVVCRPFGRRLRGLPEVTEDRGSDDCR